jgi:hypothetical protein
MCLPLPVWALVILGTIVALGAVWWAAGHREKTWTRGGIGKQVGAVAIIALLASISLTSLDAVLRRTHVPNIADEGLEQITAGKAGLANALSGSDVYQELAGRWYAWQRDAGPDVIERPAQTMGCYLDIDAAIFVPSYAFLLAIALARSMRRSRRSGPGDRFSSGLGEGASRLNRWLYPALLLVLSAAVVADEVENLLLEIEFRRPLASASQVPFSVDTGLLRVATSLKILGLLIVLLIGILPSALIIVRDRQPDRAPGHVVWRLRGLLVVVSLFAVIVTIKPLQIPDAIRRWDIYQGSFTVAVVIVFALLLSLLAGGLLAERREGDRRFNEWKVFLVSLAVVVASAIGGSFTWFPRGVAIPAAILAFVTGVGALIHEPSGSRGSSPPMDGDVPSLTDLTRAAGARSLPGLVAVIPVVALAMGAAAAALPQMVYNRPTETWLLFLLVVLVVVAPAVAAVALYIVSVTLSSRFAGSVRDRLWPIVGIAGIAAAYVWWRSVAAPWSFPQMLGTVALAAVFLSFLAVFLAAITSVELRWPAPSALAAVGFKQIPIFAFLLVWILFAGAFDHPDYHDVREITATAPWNTLSPDQALAAWKGSQPSPDGRTHPLLFITANGGGIKAAVWTALVLDCALGNGAGIRDTDVRDYCRTLNPSGDDRWSSSVFVASGVSGGSVGLVSYADDHDASTDWLRTVLGDDFVSPSVSWQLLVEAPRTLLQFGSAANMDRGEILERAWERADRERSRSARLWSALAAPGGDDDYAGAAAAGFFASLGQQPRPPFLMLNGTSVEDGCRLVVSDVRLTTDDSSKNCTTITRLQAPAAPTEAAVASRDVIPFICNSFGGQGDVRRSTAALLSARFPYVSPSGRLTECADPSVHVHVVDGGYGDNSGGASIAALWSSLQDPIGGLHGTDPCVAPVLLQIDSGYGPTPEAKTTDVPELRVPLITQGTARSIRTIEGRDAAGLPFRRPLVDDRGIVDREAIVYLRTNPEGQASLGWTMDDSTFDQLERQLLANKEDLETVAGWFANPCTT